MANFCDRVKYLRRTSEMSQNELADKIGVSRLCFESCKIA